MQIKEKKFVFNISPTRVVGAISYFDAKKGVPVVDYMSEHKIQLKKDFSLADFRKETLKAIDGVCIDFISIDKTSGSDYFVDNAEVFLMSPWVEYENYSLHDESISPFLVDDKYLNNFLEKKNIYDDKALLHSNLTSVKVNEYDVDVSEAQGKMIQCIDASFLDSFLLKFDKHFIDGAIKNHFSLIQVHFNSFIPILLNQIQRIYDPKDDFIFLDISTEITEFGIFEDGKVKEVITIPFGMNKILHKIIEHKNNIDVYQAESLLQMFLSNQLDNENRKEMQGILDEEVKKIQLEMEKISGRLPVNAFLVSSQWATNKIIKESKLFKNIYFIDRNIIDNFVDFAPGVGWDNFIALEVEYMYT